MSAESDFDRHDAEERSAELSACKEYCTRHLHRLQIIRDSMAILGMNTVDIEQVITDIRRLNV